CRRSLSRNEPAEPVVVQAVSNLREGLSNMISMGSLNRVLLENPRALVEVGTVSTQSLEEARTVARRLLAPPRRPKLQPDPPDERTQLLALVKRLRDEQEQAEIRQGLAELARRLKRLL